jgi:hypothetical protein
MGLSIKNWCVMLGATIMAAGVPVAPPAVPAPLAKLVPDVMQHVRCSEGSHTKLALYAHRGDADARFTIVLSSPGPRTYWHGYFEETPTGVDSGTLTSFEGYTSKTRKIEVFDEIPIEGRARLRFAAVARSGERCAWTVFTEF